MIQLLSSGGAKCTLHCDHKPLEPFLIRGMKIAKLDRWAMLLQEYGIIFVHIRGKDNILADAISRLYTINAYEEAIENHHSPKAQTTTHADEECQTDSTLQFISIPTAPEYELHNIVIFYKNKISSVKIKYENYMQA